MKKFFKEFKEFAMGGNLIDMAIGVIVGGISGYFGGVVDTILMRFVELFNAIPFYPMLIDKWNSRSPSAFPMESKIGRTCASKIVITWTRLASSRR